MLHWSFKLELKIKSWVTFLGFWILYISICVSYSLKSGVQIILISYEITNFFAKEVFCCGGLLRGAALCCETQNCILGLNQVVSCLVKKKKVTGFEEPLNLKLNNISLNLIYWALSVYFGDSNFFCILTT